MKYRIAIGILLALGAAGPALAQPTAPAMSEQELGGEQTRLRIMARPAQAVVESRVTTGRPYAAEATTEFVQVLGDGNKITRTTTVRVYRDFEGRTRREELGPDGAPRSISIYDPVARVSYVLNPATRVAHKAAVRIVYPAERSAQAAATVDKMRAEEDKVRVEYEAGTRVEGRVSLVAPAEAPGQLAAEGMRKRQVETVARAGGVGFGAATVAPLMSGANKESLGTKMVDGVPVDGTRQTVVIAAGAIGNQQPITVVSEQWFAADLEVYVTTKHSDPRTGETSYSLSNIVRGEPSPGLFEVPADYTIMESSYMRQPALP